MRENEQYEKTRRALETLPFAGRVEDTAPRPPLKRQGEEKKYYFVSFFRCDRMVRFKISSVRSSSFRSFKV